MRAAELVVTDDAAGRRLDRFLRRALHDLPLGRIFKLLRERKVRVNDKPGRAEQLLAAGDRIAVRGVELPAAKQHRGAVAATITFGVLFEDEHLLVVDKPAGLAVHAGSGITAPTLVDEARAYLRVPPDLPATEFAPSPAHRLDRGTSGVLVVAKNRQVMVRLAELFAGSDEVTKTYVALVKGRLERDSDTMESELEARGQSEKSRRERGPRRQTAVTHFRVVGRTPVASLVVLTIDTGRTHQIRRHFAAMGHPLAGDGRYGDAPFNRLARERWGLARMFLHAMRLEMPHPMTGTRLRLEAPLPVALSAVLKRLGLELSGVAPDRL
jgi:23S rRNA pseudouridine955/2504/2580 synthase